MSGQGEPNRVLWLATRAGKMGLSCNNFFIDLSCFGQDGWILAWFLFSEFMDLDSLSVHKH